jgi:hypothetical protein
MLEPMVKEEGEFYFCFFLNENGNMQRTGLFKILALNKPALETVLRFSKNCLRYFTFC